MTRIAIIGGGIAGLSAAFELELARKLGTPLDWHLFEGTDRLGGIVETTRHDTPEGTYLLEGGPDAWVSEKPWARDLALELGLESDLIYSHDSTRKTYIWNGEGARGIPAGQLQAMPDRMRMMVPEDLSTLDASPLFSAQAKRAYAAELTRAAELRAAAPSEDESVASFVLRHFGPEVLDKIAAPLLSGVFGGEVGKLSVQSVMAPFVRMEREHGSLIAALQARARERGSKPPQPIFTTIRRGLATLTDALIAHLPPERLHRNAPVSEIARAPTGWLLRTGRDNHGHDCTGLACSGTGFAAFDHLFLATPLDATRALLTPIAPAAAALLPTQASSAVLAAFCWPTHTARTFTVPPGFGFLVAPSHPSPIEALFKAGENSEGHDFSRAKTAVTRSGALAPEVSLPNPAQAAANRVPTLLAATFTDQKFPDRAPAGARIIRTFFGGASANTLSAQADAIVAATAITQLREFLGPIPDPDPTLTTVRRWPRSLPQYEVGHLDRMEELDGLVARLGGLTLLGNSYRGVGLPDLIHSAREAVRALLHPK
jgi:oxygen-dependent protoporphyrinogen oxidase